MSCNGPCIGVGGVCARSDVGGGVEAIVVIALSRRAVQGRERGTAAAASEARSRVKGDDDEDEEL